jgi:hypothetical protein
MQHDVSHGEIVLSQFGSREGAESDGTRAIPRLVLAVMLIPFSHTGSNDGGGGGSGGSGWHSPALDLDPHRLVALCPSIADLLAATARLLATVLHGFVPLW